MKYIFTLYYYRKKLVVHVFHVEAHTSVWMLAKRTWNDNNSCARRIIPQSVLDENDLSNELDLLDWSHCEWLYRLKIICWTWKWQKKILERCAPKPIFTHWWWPRSSFWRTYWNTIILWFELHLIKFYMIIFSHFDDHQLHLVWNHCVYVHSFYLLLLFLF